MSDTAPKRRWFRWSLLTLFMVLTICCFWLGYNVHWLRQRQEALQPEKSVWRDIVVAHSYGEWAPDVVGPITPGTTIGPWSVRLLGGTGVETIWIDGRLPLDEKFKAIARLTALFPEANVEEAPQVFLPPFDAARARSGASPVKPAP